MTQRQCAYRGVHLIERTVDVDVCKREVGIDEERNGEKSTARWRNSVDCISIVSCKFPEGSFELIERGFRC